MAAENVQRSPITIDKLPDELLLRSFAFCLPDIDSLPEPSMQERLKEPQFLSEAPLNISCVCRAWRKLALASPKLWATFVVNCFNLSPCHAAALHLWVSRSSPAPLTLSLTFLFLEERMQRDHDRAFVNTLLSCQHRWRKVHLLVTKAPDVKFDVVDVPLLEDFTLRVSGGGLRQPMVLTFPVAPNLKRLMLHGLMTKVVAPQPTLQSTVACMDEYRIFDVVRELNDSSPLLADLELDLYRAVLERVPPCTITFQSLRSLTIRARSAHDTLTCLKMLEFPILHRLVLDFMGGIMGEIWAPLLHYLEARELPLKELALLIPSDAIGEGSGTDILPLILKCLPLLTELTLSERFVIAGSFVSAMTLRPTDNDHEDEDNLCPNLRTVQFGLFDPSVTAQSIVELILSRRTAEGCALEEAGLDGRWYELVEENLLVKECVAKGMVLKALWTRPPLEKFRPGMFGPGMFRPNSGPVPHAPQAGMAPNMSSNQGQAPLLHG